MRGFTLLETIIAITIIAVTSIALVGLGASTSKQGSYLINKTIATHLAQEGLELVRNIRDTDTITSSTPWDKGINSITSGTINYNSSPTLNNIPSNPSNVKVCGNTCRLYFDANGFYTHTITGNPTNFYRMINVVSGATVDTITSEVKWIDHGKSYTIKVTTKLYDWQ
ncbi:MAG TPA: prepilin-type N-terminal cleavage/methylation domain-containing protein [Candidatus Portnoybacteria bacterium]|nr:prepilin-type N-terminal cleavage/methylation domain-containing protein [Candidatus Portnoybacteria bacterium]